MIKLEKGIEPEILTQNAATWTQAVVVKLNNGEAPTKTEKGRYNHPNIKQALIAETHGKCAYCESKLRHISYGDIEHVVPKSSDPSKWFSWPNLTLACDICNTNKSTTHVDNETFIDPYAVDPEQHFWHIGALMHPQPGCDSAALTERLLELNRSELLERRTGRLKSLLKMLDVIERCGDQNLKKILWDDFCNESKSDQEYAAMARSVTEMAKTKLGYA
jgi:uncharacterized protein (TIGR02646 family)